MLSEATLRNFCSNFIAAGVIKKKDEEKWCRTVNKLWNFMSRNGKDNFMARATTLGNYIYMESGWDYSQTPFSQTYVTFKHEARHLYFFKKYGLIFGLIIYLFLPLPIGFAYGRYRAEKAAILAELLAIRDLDGDVVERIDAYASALAGRAYFYAWPFREALRKSLTRDFKRLRESTVNLDLL